ncbi:PAS domain-containing protein [Pseudoprimorskyibacter insulae]|uniref:PAS domain-containing protein n=1 Tax=Pseudoprimorskyibacter insulae TaxID=1695997 RepID=A0A2R8AZ16_9RHOB|nr:PAS domain-containing protein [Pseudoprimorskyibacter insulae]SPF81285.1 hypothetical protein PRI8871_03107 [Pseudoprimorskyibacter insulae]
MADDQDPRIVSFVNRAEFDNDRILTEVETYWRSLCDDGEPPLRSQIHPKKIENALEYAFIVEMITSELARIRVAGCHLSELAGTGASGLPLSCLFTMEARTELAGATRQLFSRPSVVRMDLHSRSSLGRPALAGQLLMLPLRSDMGDVTRGLGCLMTTGKVGKHQRRFTIERSTCTPLSKLLETRKKITTRPLPDYLQPKPAMDHLRLVVSND